MKRRKPLTMRMLEAMHAALHQTEAGGFIEGVGDEESDEMIDAVRDASQWVATEIHVRKQRARKGKPTV